MVVPYSKLSGVYRKILKNSFSFFFITEFIILITQYSVDQFETKRSGRYNWPGLILIHNQIVYLLIPFESSEIMNEHERLITHFPHYNAWTISQRPNHCFRIPLCVELQLWMHHPYFKKSGPYEHKTQLITVLGYLLIVHLNIAWPSRTNSAHFFMEHYIPYNCFVTWTYL